MFRTRIAGIGLAVFCLVSLIGGVMAADVDCDSTYCFTSQDFSQSDDPLMGICITKLPDANTGTVLLGARVLRPGDILTAEQVDQMTFMPLRTQEDMSAELTYLPIYSNRVEKSATTTIAIRGKEDKTPVAEDSSIETYKNLPNEGTLKASDPEGQTLTYTLVRAPKRGTVVLREDGSFLYTPKKNKVGVDSFTFSATDPAGNVSRIATVTIQILKPTDSKQYTDTIGEDCRFTAEWMRNTGLFVGEKVGGQSCFYPDKTVSKGEFLTMLMQVLDIPTDSVQDVDVPADSPEWLKPYLAAAQRAGITAGLPVSESGNFEPDAAITGGEVAVMLQNALDLTVTQQTLETQQAEDSQGVPAWAASSLTVMKENGITLSAEEIVTRGEISKVLYQVNTLALDAPGMSVFRMQK